MRRGLGDPRSSVIALSQSILAAALALISTASTATAAPERENLSVSAGDFNIYTDGSGEAGAIVLVHDWFGVTPFYLQSVERLARQGYRVVAVDLYDGRSGETHGEAFALMRALDPELAQEKIDAALAQVGDAEFIAVIGFSMGVPYTLNAAARHGQAVDAAVAFYGDTPADAELLRAIGEPVLAIYGGADGTYGRAGATAVASAFSEAAIEAGPGADIVIYAGAAHAFAQPLFNQGATYRPELAEAAWDAVAHYLERRSN